MLAMIGMPVRALNKFALTAALVIAWTLSSAAAATPAVSASLDKGSPYSIFNPSGLKLGNFRLSFLDLEVPLSGIPIRVTRSYDSLRKAESLDFGFGWEVSYQSLRVEKNVDTGVAWEVYQPIGELTLCLRPLNGRRKINVYTPDGRPHRFEAKLPVGSECGLFTPPPPGAIQLFPLGATSSSMVIIDNQNLQLQGGLIYDVNTGDVWSPKLFRLTTEDGFVYDLDQQSGVKSVRDPIGNRVDFSANGILHSDGTGIQFNRNAQGKIARIVDPAGKSINYEYDGSGNLIGATSRTGATASYAYDATHGMVSYTDADGFPQLRLEYDALGRVVKQTDINGNETRFDFSQQANRRQTFTDRRGATTTYTYDARGNVTEVTDALGKVTRTSYDADDNELTSTNALNQSKTKSFDAKGRTLSDTDELGRTTNYLVQFEDGRLSRVTDANNRKTDYFYNLAIGAIGAITDANTQQTVFTYAPVFEKGHLRLITDARNGNTTFTHDAKGNVLTETNALGQVTTNTYDANSRKVTETRTRTNGQGQPVTLTRSFTYDEEGRTVSETDPAGITRRMTYSSGGRLLTETDGLGNITVHSYDASGRKIETRTGIVSSQNFGPGFVKETTAYDGEGGTTATTDATGVALSYGLDLLGRESTKTIFGAQTAKTTAYDDAGRVSNIRDGRNHAVTYTYDATGRKTSETDALGNVTSFGYDPVGNLITVTDALTRITRHEYDALNRRIKTIQPDTTFQLFEYDELSRRIKDTDRSGRVMSYGYDALGRLTIVTDAANQITRYGYDEVGQKTSQTDALGRITRWDYDNAGRVSSRTLPLGQAERFTYDTANRVVGYTDFGNQTTTYVYDAASNLKEKLLPDGTRVLYEYVPGTRRLITVARIVPAGILGGAATTSIDRMNYDGAGRLIQSNDANQPAALTYEYDASGNRSVVRVDGNTGPAGKTEYTYDGARRLTQVKAPNGNLTTFTYNPLGQRTNAAYPDGTNTTLTHDSLNRLSSLTTTKGAQELLNTSYTYNAADQRTRIEQRFSTDTGTIARVANLGYDAQGRLITESTTETNPGQVTSAFTRATSYQYDATGNRLRKIQTLTAANGPPASTTITYQVDANDRLIEEKTYAGAQTGAITGTPTSTTTYAWDNNGNQTSQRQTAGTTTTLKKYRWTPEHRLARIEQGAAQNVPANTDPAIERFVDYTYDDSGIRQTRTAYPASLTEQVRTQGLTEAQWAQVQHTKYLWDKTADYAQLVAEYDRNSLPRAVYVNANPGQGNEGAAHDDHRSGIPSGSGANGIRIGELRPIVDLNNPLCVRLVVASKKSLIL
jgi:YD repeat-containing protein